MERRRLHYLLGGAQNLTCCLNAPSRRKRGLFATVASAALAATSLTLFAPAAARAGAIFDYPGVPAHHGHIAWSAPEAPGGPPHFHHHHFHNKLHDADPPDAKEGHDETHAGLLGKSPDEPDRNPISVWVNEEYKHFFDQEYFSHGFIIEKPGPTPEYRFVNEPGDHWVFGSNGVAKVDARPMVREAFRIWSDLTVDDSEHLIMGLAFREYVDASDPEEIKVKFVDHLGHITEGEGKNRVIKGLWEPNTRTLYFGRYTDTYYLDGNLTPVPIRWNFGDIAGFPEDPPDDRRDFLDVALHEVGHIVGLDHVGDIDDIMTAGSDGRYLRQLSDDDILGARDLYSIPFPEPNSFALGAAGLITCGSALLVRRRKPC